MNSEEIQEIYIPLQDVESEHCAMIVDKGLSQLSGIESHSVELNNRRAKIQSANPADAIKDSVNKIRDLGYGVATVRKQFAVQNMTCASCAVSVETILSSIPGVVKASVNYASSKVQVEYIPEIGLPQDLKKAVQSIGYDLLIEESENSKDAVEEAENQLLLKLRRKTILAFILAIPLFLVGMFFMHLPYSGYVTWILSTPLVFWLGGTFFKNAFKQLKNKSANMDTLVALSTGVAYFFSLTNLLFSSYWMSQGITPHYYFEAAGVVIALILLGKWMEERAKGNTSKALKNLMGLQAKEVMIKQGGDWVGIPIEDVEVGQEIVVKPGEKIPVDGKVLEGSSFIDESMISGEPIPIEKTVDSEVLAGTINQKGTFVFIAKKVGKDTLLSSIIKMVEDAQGSKAPIQKTVDRIAAIFVPIVLIVSLITLILWVSFGGENGITQGFLSMVTVLVIACPCALGLATPTAIMVGVGKGADNGILIKDAESLETLSEVSAVVFDKTGTITEGKPQVNNLIWEKDAEQYASVLFSLEVVSEHPLADAVVQSLHGKSQVTIQGFQSITARGVQGNWEGGTYYVGSRKFLNETIGEKESSLLKKAARLEQEANTVVYFFNDEHLLAIISISDQIKKSSKSAIALLQKEGLKTYMLTGDTYATAEKIAKETGIDHFEAECLPADKSSFIKQLQENGEKVAMVGDGINDSNALAQADISIAMGRGSDIAMDVAKMTIINSDLNTISKAISVSSLTKQAIRQNLFWAFIYNIIGIPLAAGVLIPAFNFSLDPMIAGAAMALSSVSVVLNSLRLNRKTI